MPPALTDLLSQAAVLAAVSGSVVVGSSGSGVNATACAIPVAAIPIRPAAIVPNDNQSLGSARRLEVEVEV